MTRWKAKGKWVGAEGSPLVMGILNVTPDSFSDGGRFDSLTSVLEHAESLVEDGADLLDIGGESSRPGSRSISITEELDRIIPAVEQLVRRLNIPISVDTAKPEVARRAIEVGAAIINDIGGLRDPEMVRVVGASDVGVVIMHMQGSPATMQDAPSYQDVVEDVRKYLEAQVRATEEAGVARERIAIDPGIGFGKTFEHNLDLLRNLDQFAGLGCPLLIGTSRKGFLGKITGRAIGDRQVASVASALAVASRGASIVRVHDVAATVDAIRVWSAQNGWDD